MRLDYRRPPNALTIDNYATHKHPVVQEWLTKHPLFSVHFTPTSASWLNMVERFFRDISENRLRRGVFTSVPELVSAIDEYITHHNTNPKPFIRTKSARDILQKVIRANSRVRLRLHAQNSRLRDFWPVRGPGCGLRGEVITSRSADHRRSLFDS